MILAFLLSVSCNNKQNKHQLLVDGRGCIISRENVLSFKLESNSAEKFNLNKFLVNTQVGLASQMK